ncbi:glycosyltransferase [Winogradskyella sp. 3972H.M.0a.05]|uniref:glycosyltransferase n=1 Tax=Winogradskyella sp. 3972H.M.0a.05 TaxID=2950277 RepID=UPI00339B2EC4
MLFLDILFYAFCIIVAIQVLFYSGIFTPFTVSKPKKSNRKNIPISVLICAKNESENLKTFLPLIIEQEYSNFEIILIDDSSSDDTLDVMKEFKSKHDNIKIVEVKAIDAFWGNKKYALTLGIKAASNNFLLFTDADCKPTSKHWITEMSSHFSNSKSIVIGYSGYEHIKNSFLNKLIRFETLMTAVQYFSYARIGLPYMAVGRNLAYRKELFFNNSGYMSHMNIRSGDDDLFINQVANKENTALCFSKDSFTKTQPKTTFKDWINQKRRHVSTAKHYKFKHKFLLSLFYFSQFFFWVLAILLMSFLFRWEFVSVLILLRFISLYIGLIYGAKQFNEKMLIPFFPVLDLFLVSTQLVIFISNLISKPVSWK